MNEDTSHSTIISWVVRYILVSQHSLGQTVNNKHNPLLQKKN